MQAIKVIYLGPTDTKGSRLKASFAGGSVNVPYPHNVQDHLKPLVAVRALVERYHLQGWGHRYVLSSHGGAWYATPAPGDTVSLFDL